MTRGQPKILMLSVFAALCTSCGEPGGGGDGGVADGGVADGGVADGGVADGGGGDGGSPDGGGKETGDPGIAFTEIAHGRSSYVDDCVEADSLVVDGFADGTLAVVAAADVARFNKLFEAYLGTPAPALSLDGEIALISFIPHAPSLHDSLRVDQVSLGGSTLMVDESRVVVDGGGSAEACLYNVVTIPVVEFDTITATLSVVGAG